MVFASQIRHTIKKNQMLVPRDRVLAGVSGGADSVCLLLVLKELGYDVAAGHVNHGLRGVAADGDEAFVKALAERLGVPFFAKTASIKKPSPFPLPGGERNVEAAGRAARREFFEQLSREQGFAKIAVAHTRNDRVETFLMNLLRGSGVEGLVSMAPVTGNIVRPLIESSREAVEAYLKERNQEWRTDETNFDLSFARNRLRHVVIPRLASEFNPNLIETLSRTIEILEAEDAWMRGVVEQTLTPALSQGEREIALDIAVLRRALREALREAGSGLQDVSFEHIEAVRSLLQPGKSGKVVQIPGGFEAAREFDKLVFRESSPAPADYDYELKIPGLVHIPELGKAFRAEIIDKKANETSPERVFVDGESIGPYVRIRNWRPGDYYRPVGLPAGKLKRLFQRARIPRSHRNSWPVFVADSTIIWVASFPVSREVAPSGDSQKIVAIEALRS